MSDTIDIPIGEEGDCEMPTSASQQICEPGNQCIAMTGMGNGMSLANQTLSAEFSASAARRTQRADQLSGDAQAMWSIAMTSPTVSSAMGLRTAQESGSGAARYAPYLPPQPNQGVV